MQCFVCAVCNVLCIVWSPDELARMASVLCAEVSLKCFCASASTAEVCQECIVRRRFLSTMCVVWGLVCIVRSVNVPVVLCSVVQLVSNLCYM